MRSRKAGELARENHGPGTSRELIMLTAANAQAIGGPLDARARSRRDDLVMDPAASIVDLAERHSNGLDVVLFWGRRSGRIWVLVTDKCVRGQTARINVTPANALDVFHHPFAYQTEERPDGPDPLRRLWASARLPAVAWLMVRAGAAKGRCRSGCRLAAQHAGGGAAVAAARCATLLIATEPRKTARDGRPLSSADRRRPKR